MKCRAKQFSDTMVCDLCGLTWDTNDPVPPVCDPETGMERVRELMREHRGQLEEPEPEPGPETVVAAALQVEGFTVSLPRPARHDTIFAVIDGHISLERAIVQGFLTSAGRFVTRVEAKHIAHRAGQPTIRDNLHPRDAFSEDFW